MACNDLCISVLACKSVVVMVMGLILMSVTYNVSTLSNCAVNWGSGVRVREHVREGVGVRECVREGVSQRGSEVEWEWEWGMEGVCQGGREGNLLKNPSEVSTKFGYMKLDWFHCISCACPLLYSCEDSFYCILYHFLCLGLTPTCAMLYSDMTRTPVLSMSQWSYHVCACMHTNEMFSNWEKSREGESNRKIRGREEKRGRKGRREEERGEEGSR